MRYYRCKCGHRSAWSSLGVAECEGCEKCGTTLAEGPDGHDAPAPHDWREEWTIDKQTGERGKKRVCARCQRKEPVVFTIHVDDRPIQIQAVDVTGGQIKAMASVDPLFPLWLVSEGRGLAPVRDDEPTMEIRDGMRFKSTPPGHF